jgi:hypothetical protein
MGKKRKLFLVQSTRYSCLVSIKLNLVGSVSKNIQMSNFMKIRPLGTEFQADVQTDRQTDRQTK